MTRTQIYLTQEIVRGLKAEKDKRESEVGVKLSLSALIRSLLRESLNLIDEQSSADNTN